jgi:hypothetical protein
MSRKATMPRQSEPYLRDGSGAGASSLAFSSAFSARSRASSSSALGTAGFDVVARAIARYPSLDSEVSYLADIPVRIRPLVQGVVLVVLWDLAVRKVSSIGLRIGSVSSCMAMADSAAAHD